jgi:hypothetical protein
MKELFVQISDEKALNWLNAITPRPTYDFNKDRRLQDTCEWIFNTDKYRSWIGGTGTRDLWVVGIPGKYIFSFRNIYHSIQVIRRWKVGIGHKPRRRIPRTG